MKKILITGANSYVGTNVEKWLMKEPDNYYVETLDMKDPNWKEFDFSKFDVVFHVAGIAHVSTKKSMKELYFKVNRDLAFEVSQTAKESSVQQFIFMSSSIVYGDSAPINKKKVIDIDTPVSPANSYGLSKVEAEKLILTLNDESYNIVVIRSPMIYGKGSKGNYMTISNFSKKVLFFPYIRNQRSAIYIENLCEFIRLLIENEETGVFFPQNNEYICTSELVSKISIKHGKKIYMIKRLTFLFIILGYIFKKINKVFGNFTYDKNLSMYKEEYSKISLNDSISITEE